MSDKTPWTPPELFDSEDGSIRCRRCHLHADMCTCNPDHPMREILRAVGHQLRRQTLARES